MSRKNYPYGVPVFPAPVGANPFGEVRYVAASGGDDGNYGKNAAKPLATIAKAISLSAAGDTVILGPGTHSVDCSVSPLVPKADMQFFAAIPSYGGMPTTVVTADADDTAALCTIDVDGVGFHGIKFLLVAGAATAVNLFDIAQTTAVNGLVFKDCWFDLNSVDHLTEIVTAMTIDDATNATTGLVIKNCRFMGGDATTTEAEYIEVGVGGIPDALIEDNVFCLESIDGDCVGINFADPAAAGKSYAFVIRNNDFIGAVDYGADSVGIKFVAAMTDGEIAAMVRTNYFAYCAAQAITIDSINQGQINCYYGDVELGGVLIDPGT